MARKLTDKTTMDEETDKATKVVALIEKATNSTAAEVDPRLLKAIKLSVRYSDSELRIAAQTLMSLMKRDHSQVRYLTLLIIDELFMRSKLFRTLVAENLDQLLSLAVGFRRNNPLPAPASVATVLRSKAIEFLEKWNENYGIHYRQLRLGCDYLKDTLHYQFPNLQANAARIQLERREREARTKEILLKKFESLKTNLSSIKEEIKSTIDEIEGCLEIVRTDENVPLSPVDDEEMEEFRNSELRQIRLDSLKEGDKVKENNENKVVFDAVREFYKVLVSKHLPTMQEWISVLVRVDVAESDTRFRDSALKELIDLRNLIRSAKIKCEESGFSLLKHAESEDDIWEEGTVEKIELGKSAPSTSEVHDRPSTSTNNSVRKSGPHVNLSNVSKEKNILGCIRKVDPLRDKLLTEAPVLKWGNVLDNWGSERDVLANQRGLELDNHWGRVDYDATVPAEKIAELNVHASIYEEEPVETQPCRAPLKKGGLCQRRDLRVCPFHGPIIPRDDEGKPTVEKPLEEEMTAQILSEELTSADLDTTDLTEKLLRQAVKNVREREKEAVRKKRELDKQALKRAKLGRVREHNEAVLRDAAIASTSRSSFIGEDIESVNRSRSSGKSKKQTLASMLKKKETTKGRLAQRLLTARARDATVRQITEAEDANYREAFPNQW